MSAGTYNEGQLTANPMRLAKTDNGYDLRTTDQHIAQLERDIAILQQRVADQGMMIAQLRELVTGQPPFLAPEGNWTLNE